ncbi:MAG: 4-hydroxy-tetrahydrodipicolinate synthase [Planctomycetota bacterium]
MLHSKNWYGAFTAIATPFRDGKVDYNSLARLVAHQIDGGIRGIVPCGTTGEAPTLTEKEHHEVVEFVVKEVNRRCLVVAGTGSNSTAAAMDKTRHARDAGADAALIVSPYYNKPTQEGIFRHYEAIAKAATGLPIILYDIPGRTGISIDVDTCVRLAEIDNIVAVKEAAGKPERITALRSLTSLSLLSGDDALTIPFMSLGASGVISVASNIVPTEIVAMVSAASEGRYAEARAIHDKLTPLFRALFVESNPTPVKFALERCGIIKSGEVRLPLVAPGEKTKKEMLLALEHSGCVTLA